MITVRDYQEGVFRATKEGDVISVGSYRLCERAAAKGGLLQVAVNLHDDKVLIGWVTIK